jgi:hypothetical protein
LFIVNNILRRKSMKGKNAGNGTAQVEDVTIKGGTNIELSDEVIINLSGDTFLPMEEGTVVTTWFENIPNGLIATSPEVEEFADTITIAISGTPTVWDAAVLEIKIPGTALDSGSGIDVTENPDAKYDIAYGIKDAASLDAFANEVNNNGEVTLNARLKEGVSINAKTGVPNLPIAKNWRTTGKYTGDFDGNGGTIEIDLHGATSYLALFALNNGTIHDLTVTGKVTLDEDETSADADYIAGVVAYNDVKGNINHVIADVEITAYTTAKPNDAHSIGGIAGFNGCDLFSPDSPYYDPDPDPEPSYIPGGYIFQCRNDGNITGGFNKIGGIAGENAGSIKQCANTGDITDVKGAKDRGWPGVGGITGRNGNNNEAIECGEIEDCYNTGKIKADVSQGTGENAYGGIAGWCDSKSSAKSCFTTGDFEEETGGLRGTKNPIIGMVDTDSPDTDNNFSRDGIFASSTDEKLTGTRMLDDNMKTQAFVNTLNGGSTEPYVLVGGEGQNYPKLGWEVASSK